MEPVTGGPAKVALRGPHGEVETLWANALGDDLYALDNLPWYAYGVSLGDVIEAKPDAGGQLWLERVVRKSGNRTIRVILEAEEGGDPSVESRRMLDRVREIGCSYEGANRRLVAVNVPPGIELADVAAEVNASGLDWEYADPTYEELFP